MINASVILTKKKKNNSENNYVKFWNYKIYKELLLKSFDEFDEITAYKSIKREILVDF